VNPVTLAPIILHRGHGVRIPFDAAWSLVGLREMPGRAVLLVGSGTLGIAMILASLDAGRARAWSLATWLRFGLVFAFVSWFLPVSYELNTLIGDGLTLPRTSAAGRPSAPRS
jgi:hypothetical protein